MENMERRTFVKLLGMVGAAVGLGVKHEDPVPVGWSEGLELTPEILEADELIAHMDPVEIEGVDGYRRWAPGYQTAEWTVRLDASSPWAQRLTEMCGQRVDVQAGSKHQGYYKGRAIVKSVCMTEHGTVEVKLVSDGPVIRTFG